MRTRFAVFAALCAASLLAPAAASSYKRPALHFNASAGGDGVLAGRHGEDLCAKEHIQPGSFERAQIELNAIRSHLGYGPEQILGQLRCAPLLEIWPHSAGPWQPSSPWAEGPGWLSIRCDRYDEQTQKFDHGLEPIDGGAGYYISPHAHTTQVSGGFGSGNDGYWHYRFHNYSSHTITIQFWAFCVQPKAKCDPNRPTLGCKP